MINRREAVERISLILGGTLSSQLSAGLMGQVLNEGSSVPVGESEVKLLSELADIIIPSTDTPGAKAAGVEQFIVRLIRDCYQLEDQKVFYDGLAKVERTSEDAYRKSFVAISEEERIEVVKRSTKNNRAFFKQMKQLTVAGYFTSEIGATQALEYLPIPGRFDGDVPMKPGQKAWAISK